MATQLPFNNAVGNHTMPLPIHDPLAERPDIEPELSFAAAPLRVLRLPVQNKRTLISTQLEGLRNRMGPLQEQLEALCKEEDQLKHELEILDKLLQSTNDLEAISKLAEPYIKAIDTSRLLRTSKPQKTIGERRQTVTGQEVLDVYISRTGEVLSTADVVKLLPPTRANATRTDIGLRAGHLAKAGKLVYHGPGQYVYVAPEKKPEPLKAEPVKAVMIAKPGKASEPAVTVPKIEPRSSLSLTASKKRKGTQANIQAITERSKRDRTTTMGAALGKAGVVN